MEGFRTYNSDKEMKTTLVSVLSDRFTTDLQQQQLQSFIYTRFSLSNRFTCVVVFTKKRFNTVKSRD